jgi:hypothetical protein
MIAPIVHEHTPGSDASPDIPLLRVLRNDLGPTGTTCGRGRALPGACAVRVDGAATRLCVTLVSRIVGNDCHTLEGLSTDRSLPVRRGSLELGAHLLDCTEAPGGIGGPPVARVATALANAVAVATGKRLRSPPLAAARLV